MAVGKNKRMSKGKKGGKKKACVRDATANDREATREATGRGSIDATGERGTRDDDDDGRRDRCAFRACGTTMGRRLTPSVRSSRSVDPFTKKDWYDIKAPSMFSVRNIGKTLVSRTQGTKVGRARDEG